MPGAAELHRQRRAVAREAGGLGHGGVAGEVHREGEGIPAAADGAAIHAVDGDVAVRVGVHRQGRGGHHRGEHHVEPAEHALQQAEQLAARGGGALQGHGGMLEAEFGGDGQALLHVVPPVLQEGGDAGGDGALQHHQVGRLEAVEIQLDLFHHGAEVAQVIGGGFGAGGHLGVDGRRAAARQVGHAQAGERLGGGVGQGGLAPGVHPVCAAQQGPGEFHLRHRARHRANEGVGAEQIRRLRLRDRAQRGLQADDAAARGGNADGAAAIGAQRQRCHAHQRGHASAAGGAAAGVVGIPRVQRAAEQLGLGEGLVAQLRRGGLAQQDAAGRFQPRHRRCILLRHVIGEQLRSHRGAHAGGGGEVLGGERHAEQRRQRARGLPARHQRLGSGAGLLRRDGDEGVQPLAFLDARQRRLHRLHRRDFPPGNGGSEREGIQIGNGVAHGVPS